MELDQNVFSMEGWKHVDVEKPLSLEPLFSGNLLVFRDKGSRISQCAVVERYCVSLLHVLEGHP